MVTWIIQETENEEVLYWSNTYGWVAEIKYATTFRTNEKNMVNLPVGGKWIKKQPQ